MRTVYTTGQVAKMFGCAPRTVTKWIDSGKLHGYRLPGSNDRRIPREYLVAFMREVGIPTKGLEHEVSLTILAVGVTEQVVKLLKEKLTPPDLFWIVVAADVFLAGYECHKQPPNVAIIDFMMGRSDAIAVASRFRHFRRGAHIIGVANEDELSLTALKASGSFDWVLKRPFDSCSIVEIIMSLVNSYTGECDLITR